MVIKKVLLAGANGKLGPAIINALHSTKAFTISVLSRASSKSTYPGYVQVIRTTDDPTTDELTHALTGQDAVVVIFGGTIVDLQLRLAAAAAAAGVQRFIPADFGSCDSSSALALSLMPLYRSKQRVRQHLQQLARTTPLTWTSLVCGHFFDWGLSTGFLQIDVAARKARIFDGGEARWSATTIETIALAVVRIVQKEAETRNRMLYIQSFSITQNQLLGAVQRATKTGPEKWAVEHVKSGDYIKHVKAEVDADPGNADARENLVSVVGIIDADWEGKGDFANSLLGLETEDLDQVVAKVIAGSEQ